MDGNGQIHFNSQLLETEIRRFAETVRSTEEKKPVQSIEPILQECRYELTRAYRDLTMASKERKELSTAAEWLIDNFYIIQEQLVQLKEDMPPSYYKKLPRISEGENKGLPRVFELIQILSEISDNIIDFENTTAAVQLFQEYKMLKIGELWAIPIMIRLVLLIRLKDRIIELREVRRLNELADKEIGDLQEEQAEEPGFVIRRLTEIHEHNSNGSFFLVILAKRLQQIGLLTEHERAWFDYKLRPGKITLEEGLHRSAKKTSALHLSIQNAISSLREVSHSDWTDFVESCSVIEQVLLLDPSGYYPNMDKESKDHYRKVVEKLSAHSPNTEAEVAEQALLMAEKTFGETEQVSSKEHHIGYYLLDRGYEILAEKVKYHKPIDERLRNFSEHTPLVYFGMIFMHLAVFLGIVSYLTDLVSAPGWLIALTIGSAFMPALDLSVISTNRVLTLLLPPRILPKLKITGNIRDDFRTLVVVPTMFSSAEDAEKQLDDLEIRMLANPNKSLQYALLADFRDSDNEHEPEDDRILEHAINKVEALNQRYRSVYGERFYLLHRKRIWNPSMNKWMAWERKRGKLEELNRLLNETEPATTFTTITGNFLQSVSEVPVRYVITLDADTELPPGSALKLVSTAAHPLNRAEVNRQKGIVEHGFGILQPRISITPKTAGKTWFARIFSGNVGIDPYTTAVSDVYQDLYGEGVFTGKGLYDVRVFHQLLGERFPDNTVLSHDLLESTYLKTALLTDIELFDDYPTTYMKYSRRNHRWIRGDWQILKWLFRKVPGISGKEENPINFISKWKIFDNLRRSLNPFFMLIFLLAGWFVLPGSPVIWTVVALGVIAFPIYSSFTMLIFKRPERVRWKLYIHKIRSELKTNTLQSLTTFLILPHQALNSMDAILRTLWRMTVSKRDLLEWVTASQVEAESTESVSEYWYKMWPNAAWALFSGFLVWVFKPLALIIAGPLLAPWIITPYIVYLMGRKRDGGRVRLSKADRDILRIYARKTWRYFEKHINKEQFWLPPDNYQEDPYLGAVGRTSPTNMGLGLVSVFSAYEFGYITRSDFLIKLERMLHSMNKLDKFEGHFFNWYSTQLGEVLSPRYISTVDSGNLAASLLVIKQALIDSKDRPVINSELQDGLNDTILVIREISSEFGDFDGDLKKRIDEQLQMMESILNDHYPKDVRDWESILIELKDHARRLADSDVSNLQNNYPDVELQDIREWLCCPFISIKSQLNEISTLKERCTSKSERESLLEAGLSAGVTESGIGELISNQLEKTEMLISVTDQMITEMDFSLLYFENKHLFSIGYNLDHASLDTSTYDQLATEARLASYIAIAKGEVPPEHWFRLGRRLTSINQDEILVSWGGTMFEYLMPVLFMAQVKDTLLENTCRNVILWQKKYGKTRNKPWGLSESGYSMLNLDLHYQYRAFGAPGLGLKIGLAEDYVVSPYSTMLALMIDPRDSMRNLRKLRKEGAYGQYGFYEAIDYTSSRMEAGEDKVIVKMYMAHHQGMSLLALHNVLKKDRIIQLFHNDPLVQSCEVLLQELVPKGVPVHEPRPLDVELESAKEKTVEMTVEHVGYDQLDDPQPRSHILSNGPFNTLINHTGTGFSACDSSMLTRWRPDRIKDDKGTFIYVRDLDSDKYWSVGHQPVRKKPDRYDCWFHMGKVQIARVDEWIESFMEICVSPEDNIELRKITLTNYSQKPRSIELTSYAEVVLNEYEADKAHPAFSKLFVQTDYIPEHHAILVKRRPRSEEEEARFLVHTIASSEFERSEAPIQIETDRGNFIGRNRSARRPKAMDPGNELSGTIGNVPDPVISARIRLKLDPGEKKSVTFGLGKVKSREEAIKMADRYDNPYATERVFELAEIYARMELEHIDLSARKAHYFNKLAGYILYGSEEFRPEEELLLQNRGRQADLWSYGISGDVPVMVYKISDAADLKVVETLLKGHTLWRLSNLEIDLVILIENPTSYFNEMEDVIRNLIHKSMERRHVNKKGGIFVLRSDSLPAEHNILLETVAKVVFTGRLPRLDVAAADHFTISTDSRYRPHILKPVNQKKTEPEKDLQFYNGFGGFSEDGKEYVIMINNDEQGHLEFPPAPWINILSNPEFGCLATDSGSDHCWQENSRENKITPWSNDPVTDPPGDCIYIRDEESGNYWTPTPGPVPGSLHYKVTHGFGYSRYESTVAKIFHETEKWVDKADPVKFVRLRLRNTGDRKAELNIFRYVEWVLGVDRAGSSDHIITEYDSDEKCILARNYYNNEFAGKVAFAAVRSGHKISSFSATSDRLYFIGRNRTFEDPAVLLSEDDPAERFGTGFESCAAFKMAVDLGPGETADLYFLLGESEDHDSAMELIRKYSTTEAIERSEGECKKFWNEKLSKIQIDTPVPEFNIMMNGWLQYQNIACRMWARTGFYQSGGAYGFRDQLQDSAAAFYMDPEMTRNQILLHAAHQFPEGDVLHWWHPPTDRGTRTRITDDLLWLPYLISFYLKNTGDNSLLDEEVPFIKARTLNEDELEAYLTPELSDERSSLYDHCCRILDRSLTSGVHGIPLMGAGDWNDSMNHVGREGKGESVWLGFFLYKILTDFEQICRDRGDDQRLQEYRDFRSKLRGHLNNEGWDGNWYRRAFYDDGSPIGSADNQECKIDAIAQSWAVLSGAADPEKAQQALRAAEINLVSEQDGIIRLLTPPFDQTPKDPGYIKGYIPGVRENGGQYTHAATWLVAAVLQSGESAKAVRWLKMLSPVNHSLNKEEALKYRTEPYVVAADIYSEMPLRGMGGWTWYTGSCGWMYRVILEYLLGFSYTGDSRIEVEPSIPENWEGFTIRVRDEQNGDYNKIEVKAEKRSDGKKNFSVYLNGRKTDKAEEGIELSHQKDDLLSR